MSTQTSSVCEVTSSLADFDDSDLRNMLQNTTYLDRWDDIEIELENRFRAARGLAPL